MAIVHAVTSGKLFSLIPLFPLYMGVVNKGLIFLLGTTATFWFGLVFLVWLGG